MIDQKFQNIDKIFSISSEIEFESMAIEVFKFQYKNNKVYQQYCDFLNTDINCIVKIKDIPFLPISFFKSHTVICGDVKKAEKEFSSSGTTGMVTSNHYIKDISIYEQSFIKGFEYFYGPISDYIVLGLLPSYLEREGSSLIYMVDKLIDLSNNSESGFFLDDYDALLKVIKDNKSSKKIILLGVSYALLDLVEKYNPDLSSCIIMETGGMKGKRKEIPKTELHAILKKGLNVNEIHSEYGMTELLSQAYALKNGEFELPMWMNVLTREYNDPFSYTNKKSGGLNIIDLANVYSCSFIATQDLGKVYVNHFEVLGRFDNSDIRGCNLLVQ
jgi:phenylacetate-coenzyme A ligase PaaK-like adenylate-forming protein